MPGDRKLPAADPKLQQSRIDIDQRRAPEAGQQGRRDGIVEVQQQVRALKDRLRLGAAQAKVFPGQARSAIRPAVGVEDEFPAHSEPLHPRSKRRQRGFIRLVITAPAELFHPVNVAAQLAQAQRVLHVDPEVSPARGEVDHVERTNDHCGHSVLYQLRELTRTLPRS